MGKKLLTSLLVAGSLLAIASFSACGQFVTPPTGSSSSDSSMKDSSSLVDSSSSSVEDSSSTLDYYPSLEVYSNKTQISVGQSIQIEPVLSYGGAEVDGDFTYTSTDSSIVSVDENGKAVAESVGNVTIKVSCTYDGVYLEECVEITVLSSYTFGFITESVSVGTASKENTATVEYYLYENDDVVENPTIEWTIEDESVATVNNGVVTGVAYGSTTLTAKFMDLSIELPVKCYVSSLEGEINSFCHDSRAENFAAKVITTGDELPYAFVSTAVAERMPTHNNFLKITVTKDNTYPGLYLNPMVSKQDLLDLQEKYDVNTVELSLYLEKVSSTEPRRIPRRSWNGTDSNFGITIEFDTWTTINLNLTDIINNYDRFATQQDALFYFPNKDNGNNDTLLIPSEFNIYVDAIMAKTPTIHTISTVEDFLNINKDLGGYYVLANDIDFSAQELNNTADTNVWYTIGMSAEGVTNYDKINAFTGTIDGNGYTLKNIVLKGLNGSGISAALISKTVGATIKNLGVEMSLSNSVNNSAREVGLVGQARNTTIRNCYIRLKTNQAGYGSNLIAPIASQNYANTVKNCISILDISDGVASTTKTNFGSVLGQEHGNGSTINNTYSAMLRKSDDTQDLKIAGNATKITMENTSVAASLAALYQNISAEGVLTSDNGWNMNIWKMEDGSLKFGSTTVCSAE